MNINLNENKNFLYSDLNPQRDINIIRHYSNYKKINYYYIGNPIGPPKLVIDDLLNLERLEFIPENFLSNAIVNGNVLFNNLKVLPKGFLSNTSINGSLVLSNIRYLSKDFNPNVSEQIWLYNLKSKTLKSFIELPGIKRELGFNLLKNYEQDKL